MVRVYHRLYWSIYAHLAEQLVYRGQRVTRKDRIAIGGQTGSGAALKPHLHLSLRATSDVVQFFKDVVYDTRGTYSYFDPVDFAAHRVVDSYGNLTLPYY